MDEHIRLTEYMEDKGLSFPELRGIQQEAHAAYLSSGKKHASIIAPVGIGKTLLVLRLWDTLGRPDMLVVVPRIVLIKNPWLQEITKIGLPPASIGAYYSEEKIIKRPITICLYQTLVRNREVIKDFKLVVFDEEQVLGGESFGSLLEDTKSVDRVIGMTGTLREAVAKNPEIARELPIVFERTISEARAKKVLVPAAIEPIYSELPGSVASKYRKLTLLYENMQKAAFGASNPFKRSRLMQQAMIMNQRRLTIISNIPAKLTQALEIVKKSPKTPTLVFSECYDRRTEVLTRSGWKPFATTTVSDEILTLDPTTHVMSYVKPTRKIEQDYGGPMCSFKGMHIDMLVTPNHRMYVMRSHEKRFGFVEAQDVPVASKFKRDGIWNGEHKEWYTMPSYTSYRCFPKGGRHKRLGSVEIYREYPEIKIGMDTWLEFLGLWLAEGSVVYNKKKSLYEVNIAQKKRRGYVREVLSQLPFEFKEYKKGGTSYFEAFSPQFARCMTQFKIGTKRGMKQLPREYLEFPPSQISLLLHGYIQGDGWLTPNGARRAGTVSKPLADSIQEAFLKTGTCAQIAVRHNKRRYVKVEHRYLSKGKIYEVSESISHKTPMIEKQGRAKRVNYTGKVYCLELPKHHLMYARRNGKSCWCGNSIKSIETVKKMLDMEKIPSRTMTHKITKTERQKVIAGFGTKFNVLLSVGVLNLGYNVPQCSRAIVIASSGGMTKAEQRMGRVLRTDPNNPNKVAQIYVLVAKNTQDERSLKNFQMAYDRISSFRGDRKL